MRVGRTGHYQLKRQNQGVGCFGDVTVRIAHRDTEAELVEWRVRRDDTSSMQPNQDRDITDAAMDGARMGLNLMAQLGVDIEPYAVEVVHVQLNFLDIEQSAVRAAAVMAVADAFGEIDRVSLSFSNGWIVQQHVSASEG